MEPILSTGSWLAKEVGTTLGFATRKGRNFPWSRRASVCLPRRSIGVPNEGRSDADNAPSGRGIQGDRCDSSGDEVWKEENQSTKLSIPNLHTTNGSSVHNKERTQGGDGATPAAPGGDDGQEIQVSSGSYHLEITAHGSTTKIIFESTAALDLQVVVKRKEGQQTFAFTSPSQKN